MIYEGSLLFIYQKRSSWTCYWWNWPRSKVLWQNSFIRPHIANWMQFRMISLLWPSSTALFRLIFQKNRPSWSYPCWPEPVIRKSCWVSAFPLQAQNSNRSLTRPLNCLCWNMPCRINSFLSDWSPITVCGLKVAKVANALQLLSLGDLDCHAVAV